MTTTKQAPKRWALRPETPSTHPESDMLYPEPNPALPGPPRIRISEPLMGDAEARYVHEVMESGFISSASPMLGRFEDGLRHATGAKHAAVVTCGTHALDLLMYCLNVGPGDEVIIPAITFMSVAGCVARAGGRPVIVDIEPDSLNMGAEAVAAAITDRTVGVIAAHTYGHPCDMDAIGAVCDAHGLFLVEDACEALGASLRGRPVGGLSDVAVHSFYANKMMTTGNGGAITTNNDELFELVGQLRGYSYAPRRFFWHHHMPFNIRMSALQAAVGLGQVEILPRLVSRKKANAARYLENLAGIPGLTLPSPCTIGEHVYWMFTVHVEDGTLPGGALAVRQALADACIESRPVFSPLHAQPILQASMAPAQGPFPHAAWAARTGINLPSSGILTTDQIDEVSAIIRACLT